MKKGIKVSRPLSLGIKFPWIIIGAHGSIHLAARTRAFGEKLIESLDREQTNARAREKPRAEIDRATLTSRRRTHRAGRDDPLLQHHPLMPFGYSNSFLKLLPVYAWEVFDFDQRSRNQLDDFTGCLNPNVQFIFDARSSNFNKTRAAKRNKLNFKIQS